ncbi:MAG: hypothetical protein ACR2RL_22135 [Gammaproteobacteria bacterium]
MFENRKDRVNADAALGRRGRWVNLTFLLGAGEEDYLVTIAEGRVKHVELRPLATATGVFTIRAGRATWEEHWKAMPRRDYHDLWSMLAKGLARIDGDLLPLMQNLQYFKDVVASPRAKEA